MEIERHVFAVEPDLAGIDVVTLDFRECGDVEPLAEWALIIGVLYDRQWSVLIADHVHAAQVSYLRLGGPFFLRRRFGTLLFQKLPDLAQFLQNLISLLTGDALVDRNLSAQRRPDRD